VAEGTDALLLLPWDLTGVIAVMKPAYVKFAQAFFCTDGIHIEFPPPGTRLSA
jgi:hypothetical protein